MNHLKIGTRLGLAFGLILLITALIAALGVWRLSTLKEATVRISTVEIDRNELAMEWKAAIDLNWARASAALKTSDAAYIASLGAEMAATTKAVTERQKQLEALMEGAKSKELLDKVAATRKTYIDARSKLLERKKAGEDVFALVDTELRPLAQNYIKSLEDVTKYTHDELNSFEESVLKAAAASQWTLGIGAGVSLLLGLLFAVWATRSITTPVQRAMEAAEEISKGNLSIDIDQNAQAHRAQAAAPRSHFAPARVATPAAKALKAKVAGAAAPKAAAPAPQVPFSSAATPKAAGGNDADWESF
eukprot:gene6031-5900_t